MDDSESISAESEGGAAVNAYGSIVGDHEATGSGAIEVWSRCDDGDFFPLLFLLHCDFVKDIVLFGRSYTVNLSPDFRTESTVTAKVSAAKRKAKGHVNVAKAT